MSFSQSLLFGDDTLDQLDVYDIEHAAPVEQETNTNTSNSAEISRYGASLQMRPPNQTYIGSPDPRETSIHRTVLDVIDESPTDKKEVTLGKSIRERLKNASTSKKHQRKHLRRSKSDPLTTDDSSLSRTYQDKSSMLQHDLDALLDSSDEWNVKLKSKTKLYDKFADDSMDSFLKNIQTQPSLNNTKELIAISSSDEDVLVSEIERMINGSNHMSNATFDVPPERSVLPAEQSSNIGHQPNVNPTESSPQEQIVETSLEWEDSAFFNNLNVDASIVNDLSQANEQNENVEMKTNVDILVDADCNLSVQHVDHVNEAELESCYLEISVELSKLNDTHQQSQATPQLVNTSRRMSVPMANTQPTNDRAESNSPAPLKSQTSVRDINSLSQWGCTSAIIREYIKRGVRSMFEWQQECLSKHEVTWIFLYTYLLKFIQGI